MIAVGAAIIVAAAVLWAAGAMLAELRAAREDAARTRALALLQMFSTGIAATHADAQAFIIWLPLARTARTLFPAEFAKLDAASGAIFPFTADDVQSAHARWTSEWLAWERAHDAEYRLKAAILEHELATADAAIARARLEAVEREKLDLYQRRYQQYIQVAKALQNLVTAVQVVVKFDLASSEQRHERP